MAERLTEAWYDDMGQFDRYAPKSPNIEINCGGDDFQDIIDKLAKYEIADKEGRLVVLPCKSGKDLFGIYNGTIVEGYADGYLLEKTSVHSDADHWIWLQDKNSKNYWKIAFAEIGKTVFLTREEAEKALKEMEESNVK